MKTARRNRAPLLLLALVLCACSSSRSVYPPNGSVWVNVVDPGLGLQTATVPSVQQVRWTLVSVDADIEGFGSYQFLGVSPCTMTANVLSAPTLQRSCGGSGVVIDAEGARTATVHVVLSGMEARRAYRPDLPATGDYDGDGVPNGVDNCPLVPNPDQALYPGQKTGLACTLYDSLTATYYLDSDGDRVDDDYDNCVYVPNLAQVDSDRDGIGDAREQIARVVVGPAPVKITPPAVTFVVSSSRVVRLNVQIDDRTALVGCDPAFTRCYLNPEAITVAVQ